MGDEMITTGVDRLIQYLEGKEKVPLLDAATVLGVDVDTLQSWVDFLVEERILGIEYKFTKPFIYLNKEEEEKARIIGEEDLSWDAYHRVFLERARAKQIPELKSAALWKSHVLGLLDRKQALFTEEARKRGLDPARLWAEYKTEVLTKI